MRSDGARWCLCVHSRVIAWDGPGFALLRRYYNMISDNENGWRRSIPFLVLAKSMKLPLVLLA